MESKEKPLISDELLEHLFPEDNDLGEDVVMTEKCKKISSWGMS